MRFRTWMLSALAASAAAIVACAQAQLGNPTDATSDASSTDAPAIDAPMTDAPTIDASPPDAAVDAQPIDARVVDASTCPTSPCDILEQCGCTGQAACDVNFQNPTSGTTACRNAGSGTESTECSAATTCAEGYVCSGGRCRRYCDEVNETDNECPGPGGACLIELTYNSQTVPNAPLMCTTNCIPSSTTNSGICPSGWACHVYFEAGGAGTSDDRYVTDCDPAPSSGGGVGTTCASNRDCAPGNDCVTFQTGKQCRPTCECSSSSDCSGGACPSGSGSCHSYATPLTIGNVTYGVCYSP